MIGTYLSNLLDQFIWQLLMAETYEATTISSPPCVHKMQCHMLSE